jgi:hypothetical protein
VVLLVRMRLQHSRADTFTSEPSGKHLHPNATRKIYKAVLDLRRPTIMGHAYAWIGPDTRNHRLACFLGFQSVGLTHRNGQS